MGIVVAIGGRFKISGVFIIHRGSCVTGATSSLRELLLLPRVVCVFIRGGVVTNGGLSAAVSSSLGAASSPEAASSPRNLCHRRRFVTGRFLPTLKFSVSYTRYVASFTKQNRLPAGGSSSGEASVDSNNDGDNDSGSTCLTVGRVASQAPPAERLGGVCSRDDTATPLTSCVSQATPTGIPATNPPKPHTQCKLQ